MQQSFPSSEKLKSKTMIGKVFSEGKSISQFPIKLMYASLANSEDIHFKVGVSVPKRNFKKAVERIHLKRLLRESYRKNKYLVTGNMPHPYAFMFIYVGKEPLDYNKIFLLMEKLLKKFVEKENNSSI